MDYKEKYEKALERAREFQKSKDGLCVLTAESIFPELKENEDEKMWKLIKKYAHCNISAMALNADHISRKELETWLEKQSEQKKQLINKACDVLVNCIEDFMCRRMEIWDKESKKQTLENIRKTLEE